MKKTTKDFESAIAELEQIVKTLERHLGLLYVVSISLGAMLGAGLFVLPGMATYLTGSSLWLAFLIAGICVVPGALSKSELATAMPSSGEGGFLVTGVFDLAAIARTPTEGSSIK